MTQRLVDRQRPYASPQALVIRLYAGSTKEVTQILIPTLLITMSNDCKYLQAFFLPLRLPVAEALKSIEKDCPGKIRHRQCRKE